MIKFFILFVLIFNLTAFPNPLITKKVSKTTPKLCFDKACLNIKIKDNLIERQSSLNIQKTKNTTSILESHKKTKKIIAWTKYNTKPMDIVWLDENLVIVESIENIPVLKKDIVIPNNIAKHILKMPGGTIKNKELSVGQKARLFNPASNKSSKYNLIAKK